MTRTLNSMRHKTVSLGHSQNLNGMTNEVVSSGIKPTITSEGLMMMGFQACYFCSCSLKNAD